MSRPPVSVCHGLQLMPLSSVAVYSRSNCHVLIQPDTDALDAHATPGSARVSESVADGIRRKHISYSIAAPHAGTCTWLEILRAERLIAIYTDENGRRRVCGSPDYPLSLDYSVGDGVATVTLTGSDTIPDAFLA